SVLGLAVYSIVRKIFRRENKTTTFLSQADEEFDLGCIQVLFEPKPPNVAGAYQRRRYGNRVLPHYRAGGGKFPRRETIAAIKASVPSTLSLEAMAVFVNQVMIRKCDLAIRLNCSNQLAHESRQQPIVVSDDYYEFTPSCVCQRIPV